MVDDTDYCELARKLRETRTAMLTGEMVQETHLGNNSGMKFAVPKMNEVEAMLEIADRKCAIQNGDLKPVRIRYAFSGRARPY